MRRRLGRVRLRRERRDAYLRLPGVEAPLLLSGFPAEVGFGFLGRALPTSGLGQARLQLEAIPRRTSLDLLHQSRAAAAAELSTGDAGPHRSTAELEVQQENHRDLARAVAAGDQELWRLGISVTAGGATEAEALRGRATLERTLGSLGFRTRVPSFEVGEVAGPPDLTSRGQKPMGYWHTLPTEAVAAFFPFADETVAERGGLLVGLALEDACPIFLNRWDAPSHSWGIFGCTAAGKSFAAGLWSLRSRWTRSGVTLYLVDPLGELAGLAEALGGTRVTVGPNSPQRLNPLTGLGSRPDSSDSGARFGRFLATLFPTLTDDDRVALDAALAGLARRSTGPEPILSDLLDEIGRGNPGGGRLTALLDVFRSGSLAYLDGPTNIDLDRPAIGIDLSEVPPDRWTFHLAYLLDALLADIQRRPGPKLLVIDEAHRLTADPATAEFLDRFVRSARHYQAGALLLSQNPDDFLQTESGRSTLRNLAATLLLRLNQVSAETQSFYSLTAEEVHWLERARLPREVGYSEGLLRHGPDHLPLAVVASTPEFEFLTEATRPRGRGAPVDRPAA